MYLYIYSTRRGLYNIYIYFKPTCSPCPVPETACTMDAHNLRRYISGFLEKGIQNLMS